MMLAASAASTEWSKVIRRVLSASQHNVVVIAGFEIVKDIVPDFAISVNQEADAMNTIVVLPMKDFSPQTPNCSHTGGPHQTGA